MFSHFKRTYQFVMVVLLLLCCSYLAAQNDAALVKDFETRVQHYQGIKNDIGVPNKQTDSPNKIADQKQQATDKAQSARPAAKQGDIFSPAISTYFKKQIRSTLRGRSGKKIHASLNHAEPVPNMKLEVNAPYPEALPLQSTPPTLLLNLPPLPKGLQYRIVGSTLFLYDETSRLVIDFIPGAIT